VVIIGTTCSYDLTQHTEEKVCHWRPVKGVDRRGSWIRVSSAGENIPRRECRRLKKLHVDLY
jgi:hypothetical protein